MERLAGDEWTNWIRFGTDRQPGQGPAADSAELARRLVPADYPAYAKIFHRVDSDASVEPSKLSGTTLIHSTGSATFRKSQRWFQTLALSLSSREGARLRLNPAYAYGGATSHPKPDSPSTKT
jgi:hypothetical protein